MYNKTIKTCRHCGNDFHGTRNQILCSEKCYLEYHSKEATENNIYTNDKCREWTGNKDRSGYGKFSFNRRNTFAHRASYEIYKGPIPKDKNVIRHMCHNPVCVNPNHLECGTHQDNHDDQKEAGRLLMGEKNPACILSDEAVKYIKDNPTESYKSLQEKFKVSHTTIWKVRKNIRN